MAGLLGPGDDEEEMGKCNVATDRASQKTSLVSNRRPLPVRPGFSIRTPVFARHLNRVWKLKEHLAAVYCDYYE